MAASSDELVLESLKRVNYVKKGKISADRSYFVSLLDMARIVDSCKLLDFDSVTLANGSVGSGLLFSAGCDRLVHLSGFSVASTYRTEARAYFFEHYLPELLKWLELSRLEFEDSQKVLVRRGLVMEYDGSTFRRARTVMEARHFSLHVVQKDYF